MSHQSYYLVQMSYILIYWVVSSYCLSFSWEPRTGDSFFDLSVLGGHFCFCPYLLCYGSGILGVFGIPECGVSCAMPFSGIVFETRLPSGHSALTLYISEIIINVGCKLCQLSCHLFNLSIMCILNKGPFASSNAFPTPCKWIGMFTWVCKFLVSSWASYPTTWSLWSGHWRPQYPGAEDTSLVSFGHGGLFSHNSGWPYNYETD